MNRRRMMMLSSQSIRHELEINQAGYWLGRNTDASGVTRNYYTVYSNMAVVVWIRFKSYISGKLFYTPFLVSLTHNGAIYKGDILAGTTSKTYTVEYNGKIWYYSDVPYSIEKNAVETDLIILNDITGLEFYDDPRQSTKAVQDVLDYYYGKI